MPYPLIIDNLLTLAQIAPTHLDHHPEYATVIVGPSPLTAEGRVFCTCGTRGESAGGSDYLDALRGAWAAIDHQDFAA